MKNTGSVWTLTNNGRGSDSYIIGNCTLHSMYKFPKSRIKGSLLFKILKARLSCSEVSRIPTYDWVMLQRDWDAGVPMKKALKYKYHSDKMHGNYGKYGKLKILMLFKTLFSDCVFLLSFTRCRYESHFVISFVLVWDVFLVCCFVQIHLPWNFWSNDLLTSQNMTSLVLLH